MKKSPPIAVSPVAVSEQEAAQYTSYSVSFLRKARMNGNLQSRTPGPPFIRQGRSIRYLISDLDNWLQKNRVDSSKAGGAA